MFIAASVSKTLASYSAARLNSLRERTGENGLTLYIHTEEGTGDIVCVDDCLTNWPALEAPVDAGDADASLLGEVTRPDGLVQVTYNGFPLYYFAGDSAEGDATGDGLNGVWFIADPAGN